jgi:hypothetical protein
LVSALGKGIAQALDSLDYSQSIPLPSSIPIEPEQFYQDFGYLQHPLTRKPVTELAPYQLEVWKALFRFKRVLAIKSQKIGISTSQLLTDFQLAILPSEHPMSCRGYDQLLLAQTKEHAREHLRTLRKLITNSKKYNAFLIDRPMDTEEDSIKRIIRDEASKSAVLFLRNPENERQPSRIIALGLENEGAIQSWKNVKGIHISDATAAQGDISASLNFAISRLALTMGSIIIECPPSPPSGPIYELWQKNAGITEPKEGQFKVFEIPATEAVNAKVMTQAWLDSEKERDPINFPRLYEAKFSAVFGNVFSATIIEKAIQLGEELEKKYGEAAPRGSSPKSAGYDPAFGSSKFGECIIQKIDGILQVIHSDEKERPVITDQVYDATARIKSWGIDSVQVDASSPEFIKLLKKNIGERLDYENVEKERHKFMKIKPIPFGPEGRAMLQNSVILMEKGLVAIHPRYDKLLTALRTAIAEDYKLDKDRTVCNDAFDAWILALKRYSWR